MSDRLYLKPARSGELLEDTKTGRILPPDGGYVPDTPFWRRRLAQGDALEAEAPAPSAAAQPPTGRASTPQRRESE